MITKAEIEQCKNALLKRQAELIARVQDHFGMTYAFSQESMGELSHYDNHPGDHGTELYERSKDTALNEHAENELEQINEALHAIEEGTYGICTECGRDIPFARLIAIPTTDRCIDHADDQVFERDRPVEESVFSPNINPDEVTKEIQTGYDAEDAWQDVSRYGTSETPSDFYGDHESYDEMFPNSDENIGSVEDQEGFLAADQEGKFTGVKHKRYEAD
ncbi:MAG TPA: TraR/DksA C4-type zinc finger protein [Bacillota bacterium]|nr:TraR/DksA C4-type zinc finger protein [Bacillota bacterium]